MVPGARAADRRDGRIGGLVVGAVVFSMVTFGAVPIAPTAQAADPDTVVFADAIGELAALVATASTLEELGEAIPLTGIAPAAAPGLDALNALVGAATGLAATLGAGNDAPDQILDELEANDVTIGSTVVAFGCPSGAGSACATPVTLNSAGGVVDYVIPITATRSVNPALVFESNVFDMAGQPFPLSISLSTALHVRFDTNAGATEPIRLLTPPAISLSVQASGVPDIVASSRIGVTDVTATLSGLGLDLSFAVTMVDPDGLDGLTRTEWMTTQVVDLVADVGGVVRNGTLAGSLAFDSSLVAGAPDATISIADGNLSNGFDFMLDPAADLASLFDFTLISPAAIIAGIGQAAAGIGGAQSIGDKPLPFLDGSVRKLAQASRPILDAVDALGVICGTEGAGNVTPAGSIEDLDVGQHVFCRAIVTTGVKAGTVVWTPVGANAVSGASGAAANGTVGTSPTKNAEFVMSTAGDFDVAAAYTATFDDDNNGTVDREVARTSTLPPFSVQQLAQELDALGGFDATPATLFAYEAATHALRADLKKTFDPPAISIPVSVGDQLESQTGVTGLRTESGSVAADASGVVVDLTAGVFLLPEAEWNTVTVGGGCPDPSIAGTCADALNLFFVEVDPVANEFKVQEASFTVSSPSLVGRLGYLEVTATAPTFTIARSDVSKPVITVDLVPNQPLAVDGVVVPNAIALRELLFDIVGRTQVSPLNLRFDGAFNIAASLNGAPIASAGATVTWNPVLVGPPVIVPDVEFADLLASFNPVPNLFGTHTGADSTTVLTASGAVTFAASTVGSRVTNMADGSSCEIAAASGNQLTCASALAGGSDNTWQSGDLYRVEVGSPLAMLEALLDNLDQIVLAIDNVSGAGLGAALDTELPIVGVSPRALLTQIKDLRRSLAEIRQPAADVRCGLANAAGTLTGDPSELVIAANGGTATIYCNAIHNKPATDVVWGANAPFGITAAVTPPADPSTTVGAAPSNAVAITFTNPGPAPIALTERISGEGYQIDLAFSDVDGGHDTEYPSLAQPATLQQLERVVQEKLGAGAGFSVTTTDVSGTDAIVLDLQVGRCTTATLCATPNATAITASLNADVSGVGGLVAATSGGDVTADYNANARLRLAFALAGGSPQVWVMPETGITLNGRFAANSLDFSAALGPFAVVAGTSAVDDNGTPSDATDDLGGLGTVQLGADLTIGGPSKITAPVAIGTFLGSLGTYLAPEFASAGSNDCGTIVTDTPNPGDTVALTGLGCAAISIGLQAGGVVNYVADLGLTVDLTGGSFTITPHIPADLAAQLAAAALDLELLLKALPEIIGSVESALRASASTDAGNGKLPLIGDALDAGADVAGALRTVAQTVVDNIPAAVYDADTVDGLTTALQNFIYDQLNPTGLLMKGDGTAITGAGDILVLSECGACTKSDVGSTLALQDLRVIFGIGQSAATDLPFDLGMDGVPLRLAGSLAPQVDWHFVVDLGLSRSEGPYIGVKDPGGNVRDEAELTLSASIGLGDAAPECPTLPPPELSIAAYSASKCLGGQIAFLSVNAADSVADPTSVGIDLKLDITNGSSQTIGINNASDVDLEPSLTLEANVDLFIRTGIVGGQDAGFPSVVGTFGLDWGFDAIGGGPGQPLEITFENLYLDVGPLITQFIEPVASEIRRYTGPFQPIIDTLTAPIPVVSDLAELVGQPPVTLLGLMEVISGNDLSLIQSIAAFISFINTPLSGTGYFPLGGGGAAGEFGVVAAGARSAQGPTSAADLVTGSNAGTASLLSIDPVGGSSNLKTNAAKTPPSTKAGLPGTFGVPGLTFPFLDNPGQIFGLLLGQDITLIRYDFGPLEASAGFSYNFPPIMVGPVPIAIGVGGSVTVKGRFAVGYDTSGLRKVLSGGSGLYLFDGIFIDDLDVNGVDVPEVSFIGEVYAQAGVTIGIATAGIVAGLRITVDLNLDDSPDPDGKLRIEEILNKLQNPICLFEVSGKLEAFIKAFFELDLFLVELRFDFTLLEIELLNFSGKCEPPKPVLAAVSGSTLILNIGPRANLRNVAVDEKDEEITVRPINNQGGFSVSAFGIYQTYGKGGEFNSDVVITAISADAADGDDTLQMLPGRDQEAPPAANAGGAPADDSIPFSIGVSLNGGDGNDVIVGGDGNDALSGGPGDDRLQGGRGVDNIDGDGGNDTINGDLGNDDLDGGDGDDQIQGGPGNDVATGGPGNDLVQGGPGTGTEGGTDGDDDLAGGPGIDTVEGGTGDDKVFGDEKPASFTQAVVCAGDTTNLGGAAGEHSDKVVGGDGDDIVYGGHGDDELFGGSGKDLLCGNQGADLIDGDLGSVTTETDTNPDPQVNTSGGNDTAYGGSGADTISGNWGHDFLLGNGGADLIHGDEGNDDISGGAGGDQLHGDVGFDVIVGDDAAITQQSAANKAARAVSAPLVALVPSVGGGSGDVIRGGPHGDAIWGEGGNDDIDGGDGDDHIFGNDGADDPVRGGKGDDVMEGNDGVDRMYGDNGDDRMFGNGDGDIMNGNAGDDHMQGNAGADIMWGDGGQDDMIGGSSSTGASDGADIMFGGALADVMVGDNGDITRPSGSSTEPLDPTVIIRSVTLRDVGNNAVGGGDFMRGDAANDRMFGGNQDDVMFGDDGRDLIEGNDGNDDIEGNAGPDRIAGGSSNRATLLDNAGVPVLYDRAPDRSSGGGASGDLLDGNDGDDVVAGDNAVIAINGTVQMTNFAGPNAFGADTIHGNDGQDRLYGQLGGDLMFGDADEDYLIGDLGFIMPGSPTGLWPGGAPIYEVDLASPGPDVVGTGDPAAGGDIMRGNGADDHMFGGAGDDDMQGNAGDDYMEGNGGRDAMYGNAPGNDGAANDQDDMIGGSSSWTRPGPAATVRLDEGELIMQGNGDRDVMTGDNADIVRVVVAGDPSAWAADEVIPGARKRVVILLDREKLGTALDPVGGPDHMQGNGGSDRMFGESDADLVQGNDGDDLIEGNQGGDWLEGNDGEDDIIGGSSLLASAGGAPLAGAGADLGDPDEGDAIFGGAGADVIVADNGIIIRKTPGNTAAYQAALTATGLAAPYFTTDPNDAVPGWWLGVGTDRLVRLLDRSTVNGGRFGGDVVSAGAGPDVVFGQDGADWATGGTEGDTMEGNGGADVLYGDRAPEAATDVPALGAGAQAWVAAMKVSTGAARDGADGPAGEDDIVGGSNVEHRDMGDTVQGDGEDDFILGDNGRLQRQISAGSYVDAPGDGAGHTRIFRRATRLGVATPVIANFGADLLIGNDGDDAIWGQDGNDDIRGHAGDDDLIGELGNDKMFGGTGEDAMIGDRGSILNTELGAPGAQFIEAQLVESYSGPPFLTDVKYHTTGRYDRRVDLAFDRAGAVGGPFPGTSDVALIQNGVMFGGHDTMRGGPDHDSMHGAFGDDIMNGDDGGDWLFGADGSDVMWGGRGHPDGSPNMGSDYGLVDRLFGGRGGDPNSEMGIITGGADVLDYKPRTLANSPYQDPQAWHDAVAPYDDGTGNGGSAVSQHHQGTDWIYGGWDRDVMEGNVATPGPNEGDRLWDWTGAYNLYTHCTPDYGGFNDQRTFSPQMVAFLERLAYDSGAGRSLADIRSPISSGFGELALVYKADVKSNSSKAYPTTPGHFDEPAACNDD